MTSWLITSLWGVADKNTLESVDTVIVEGPLSQNPVYLQVLQSLNPRSQCFANHDDLEGTARGAWMLANRGAGHGASHLLAAQTLDLAGLAEYHTTWLAKAALATP